MARAPSLNQGIPDSPFVNTKDGTITLEWRQFLQSLWQRTGGAIGQSSDGTKLQAEIDAEAATRAAADQALANGLALETTARTAADATERLARIAGDNFLQSEIDAEAAARRRIVVVLPLATGDLPGPVLIADPFGQCVGAPL